MHALFTLVISIRERSSHHETAGLHVYPKQVLKKGQAEKFL
jgi:hypothetical protein